MPWAVLLCLVAESNLGQLYLADPGARTPVLPALARGWLPPPGCPSDAYIVKGLAAAGRTPGDRVVSRRLEREQLAQARAFPGVGRARVWTLSYRCEVVGPDGPYTVYADRTALVLER